MKKHLSLLLCALLLTGCSSQTVTEVSSEPTVPAETQTETTPAQTISDPEYTSRFASVTEITLSDAGIRVDGGAETDAVFTSRDIIYYEDRDTYTSGNPYGEGTEADRHTAEEAAAHTVVNITAPGAYRVTGTLSAGQLRVDLGDDAYEDSNAVVELILQDADITCTVAPAILFLNTYECDGLWSTDAAVADVDTSAAGANLILEGENTVSGSYVARIYKDQEGEKKLWKQDGAIYSYMSMNVFGPGSLSLTAANEGLDTELHLTVNGGDITIFSDNDGINTNEDGVSVTTINGGCLTIFAGLGAEGDGIDSNGYLVINGGTVFASANPGADAGMDSDLGSFIHGGTVIALGSTMDWAESDSRQVTLNLQFSGQQTGGTVRIRKEDGTEVFSLDPRIPAEYERSFSGMILSAPSLQQGETYHIFLNDTQLAYTGTDVRGGPGGMGQGERPETPRQDTENEEMPQFPEGETMPADFDPSQFEGGRGQHPEGMKDMTPPEGFDGEMPEMPEGETLPEGEMPAGQEGRMPQGGSGGRDQQSPSGEADTAFYMNDMVNCFSGVTSA